MFSFVSSTPLRASGLLTTPSPCPRIDTRAHSWNRRPRAAKTRMVVDDVAAVQVLDMLKGVVIGPTVNEIAAAVAGGTVGVMGTLIALEIGRERARERKQCPYCRGSGKLPCGHCYTLGAIPSPTALPTAQVSCDACSATGYVQCNHCEGEGRLLPIEYERALRAQYEDYVFTSATDDYYQDGPPYM